MQKQQNDWEKKGREIMTGKKKEKEKKEKQMAWVWRD